VVFIIRGVNLLTTGVEELRDSCCTMPCLLHMKKMSWKNETTRLLFLVRAVILTICLQSSLRQTPVHTRGMPEQHNSFYSFALKASKLAFICKKIAMDSLVLFVRLDAEGHSLLEQCLLVSDVFPLY